MEGRATPRRVAGPPCPLVSPPLVCGGASSRCGGEVGGGGNDGARMAKPQSSSTAHVRHALQVSRSGSSPKVPRLPIPLAGLVGPYDSLSAAPNNVRELLVSPTRPPAACLFTGSAPSFSWYRPDWHFHTCLEVLGRDGVISLTGIKGQRSSFASVSASIFAAP